MTIEAIEKVFSHRDSLLNSGLSMFIVTKQNHLTPHEVTYNTVYSDGKIFDEFWLIHIEDIECFEIA